MSHAAFSYMAYSNSNQLYSIYPLFKAFIKWRGSIYHSLYKTFAKKTFEGIPAQFLEQATKKLHELAKKSKPITNDVLLIEGEQLISAIGGKLNEALGYGVSLADYIPDKTFLDKLTKDVWIFSGCKGFKQLKEATGLLRNSNGEVKPWNKYRDEILYLHKTYNVNYLKSEYEFAIASSQMAVKWQDLAQDADRYYLQYRTANDERVRASHAILNKITLPATDPFWDKYYAPNGWRCRCNVVKVLRSRYKKSDSAEAMASGQKL